MIRLKTLRKNNNISVQELAKILNISVQSYYKYEKGTAEPSLDGLKKLADYFDVSLDYLVDRQFNNQIGYIPDNCKHIVKNILKLNELQRENVDGYIKAILTKD